MIFASPASLRRALLAASVLDDVDLAPADVGVRLDGVPALLVGWSELRRALAGTDPESSEGRARLTRWLRLRRLLGNRPQAELTELARPLGMPVEHPAHPGLDWVRSRVLGDALDLGLAFVGLDPADPDACVVVPEAMLRAAGIDADPWWPPALDYLELMGRRAVERAGRQDGPLRPMGDCDVVTLLGSGILRRHLAGRAAGMAPVAAPMRDRGWTDLRHIDPAFAVAAATATPPERRGFTRPLLVTAEELTMVGSGGRPAQIVLRDAAPVPSVWASLYR